MNKIIPVVVLCTAAVLTTIILQGCGDKTTTSDLSKEVNQKYLTTFLSLHNQYCEKKYDSSENLMERLNESSKLSLAKNFDGVYEVLINKVSFAVSPEEDGCTTDVMVQIEGKDLFSFEDINTALLNNGYIETGKSVSRKDIGTDQTELTVIEKKYISPSGEVTTLDFPLEKKNKYYMTLFVEKFTEAKKEIKEKMLQNLRMASR